ncbi:MAG: phosphoenolpyruvate synthase, partial [Pseudomonadales bacterium]|nr:phosphoenolpyruvate synthase [Pseudomonadales bacterium]
MDVVSLDEVSRADIDLVGGKGANLGELMKQGFPVPPGFVVTAQVYGRLLDRFNSDPTLSSDTDAIRASFESADLDEPLINDIVRQHEILQGSRDQAVVYAVRSSATAEDLGDASFAGQHETYYYVTAENLIPMIRKCWASLWSEAACSYRQSRGIDHNAALMAVVVQELIQADTSGVTFTADPLNGNEERLVTEASWWMCADIV